MQKNAMSITEFTEIFPISRATLYKLWKQNLGPRFFYIGRRRLISNQAASNWVKELEQDGGAKL